MASQNEWKNPSDIMKTHFMQRHSSFSLSKSKSVSKTGISRRHSFTILSQTSDNNQNPQLRNSICDTSFRSQDTASQKRKNPFGCDTMSGPRKRMSVLNQDATAENLKSMALSQTVMTPLYPLAQQTGLSRETDSSTETKQNRLICALTLQEQRDSDKLLQINPRDTDRFDKLLSVNQHSDVLKENSVILNVGVASGEFTPEHHKVCSSPPLDWSLKSKVRVTVHTSVASFKKYPGIDAKNMDSYVHHKLDNTEWKDLDIVQQIKRCCLHYSYPHMPWLTTFPRLLSDFKSRLPSVIANSRDVLESLHKDWSCTFTSIYQQLQAGLCPYFYVCAYQFSVLFRCQRSPDSTSWSALLSPSTRGLREILTKEGIEFKMPNIRSDRSGNLHKRESGLHHKNETNTLSISQPGNNTPDNAQDESSQKENTLGNITDMLSKCDDSSDDENDIYNDDEASRWLEGMGLDKKDFPSLEPCKVRLQREGFREIDNRPQSLIYVEGVDVHSFFNFLLNYPSIIASSGPQHGIPPTILSPVSFVGGRLVQNMVKHTTLNGEVSNIGSQMGSPRNKCTHVFEITGPVLPHHALNIASILHNSPDCEASTVSFSTHAPSTAFNTQIEHNVEKDKLAEGLSKLFVDLSQANPGLLQDVKHQLCVSPVLEIGTSVREMQIRKSGYSWTC